MVDEGFAFGLFGEALVFLFTGEFSGAFFATLSFLLFLLSECVGV